MKKILLILLLASSSYAGVTISGDVTISGNIEIVPPPPAVESLGYFTDASFSSQTIGNSTVGTNKYGNMYTTVLGGALDSVFFYGSTNFNGTDTVSILIYDDNASSPNNLVAESGEMEITSGTNVWHSASISGSLSATTVYWLFIYNRSLTDPGNVKTAFDANTITGQREADPVPADDPMSGGTPTNDQEYSMYIRYNP